MTKVREGEIYKHIRALSDAPPTAHRHLTDKADHIPPLCLIHM